MRINQNPDCFLYSDEEEGYVTTNALYDREGISTRFMLKQAKTFEEVYTYYGYSILYDRVLKVNASRCNNTKDKRLTMEVKLFYVYLDNDLQSIQKDENVTKAASELFFAACNQSKSVTVVDEDTLVSALYYMKLYLPDTMQQKVIFTTNDYSEKSIIVNFAEMPELTSEIYTEYITLPLPSKYRDRFCDVINKLYNQNGLRYGVVERFEEIMTEKHLDDERKRKEQEEAERRKREEEQRKREEEQRKREEEQRKQEEERRKQEEEKRRRQKEEKRRQSEEKKSSKKQSLPIHNVALKAHSQLFFTRSNPMFLAEAFLSIFNSGANNEEIREYLDLIAVDNDYYKSYRALLLHEKSDTELMSCILFLTDIFDYDYISSCYGFSLENSLPSIYLDYLRNYFSFIQLIKILIKNKVPFLCFTKLLFSLIKNSVKRRRKKGG